MPGTILILDGVPTNRIMLKAMLTPAGYGVEQGAGLDDLPGLVTRNRPDIVLCAWSLPGGDAIALRRTLDAFDPQGQIPVVALTPPGATGDRRAALESGIADVLPQPLDEGLVQARIRSLLRGRLSADGLSPRDNFAHALGFAEPAPGFAGVERVVILAADADVALRWQAGLTVLLRQPIEGYEIARRDHVLSGDPAPDAVVVALGEGEGDPALRVLSELRSHSETRHTAIVAVPARADAATAARALDLGADDVLPGPFDSGELALRLKALLRRKRQADHLRDTVRNGLRAALIDPMTGLYNRRYALPHLARTARRAAQSGRPFAVMLADLDHFKRINDRHGHQVGDAVLTEAAERLRGALRPQDMIARVGGEEFLIVLPDTDETGATAAAERLCRRVRARPFRPEGCNEAIEITVSVGVVVGAPACAGPEGGDTALPAPLPAEASERLARALIGEADRALYESKGTGRDRVTMVTSAA